MVHELSNFEKGMVSAAHPLAAAAGKKMITEYNGNAVDAAIATAFALGVVDPGNSGIGGYGGIAVIYLAEEQEVKIVDFNTQLPIEAVSSGITANDEEKKMGHKAISVPGVVAGLHKMLDNFGTLDWEKLIQPAIDLAEKGFVINKTIEETLQEPHLSAFPETVKEFFDENEQPLKKGAHHSRPLYAKSLEEISTHGPDYFYKGKMGKEITKYIQDNGGFLSLEDMKNYEVSIKDPITIDYKGYDIFGPPENSGTFTMMQTLKILEEIDLAEIENRSSSMINIVSRAMGLAWKDRNKIKGDKKSVAKILKKDNIKQLASLLEGEGPIELETRHDIGHTTHLSTADSSGNVVALTLTHGPLWYGSGVTIPQTGIVMNNGMMLFQSDRPDAEAVNNLTPTIVLKDDKPLLSVGTPGATKIITIITNFLIDVLDYKLPINGAISNLRFHYEGDYLFTEDLPKSVQKELEDMGYKIKSLKKKDFYGPASGIKIMINEEKANFEGAMDPRYEGGVL